MLFQPWLDDEATALARYCTRRDEQIKVGDANASELQVLLAPRFHPSLTDVFSPRPTAECMLTGERPVLSTGKLEL